MKYHFDTKCIIKHERRYEDSIELIIKPNLLGGRWMQSLDEARPHKL